MLFLNTLLFQLVSSVFLPVSDIEKVVAVTHAHLTLPPIPGPFHGLGSSETGIKLLSPANRRPSMHVDVRPPARISGSERTFEDISHTEVLPINSDITISPTTSGIQPRIKSPKQYPKALSNATPVLEEPPLERQDSFTTKFNQDFDTQGQVGACHIFATLEVIHDATNGFKLSKEKLFLDHLFSLANKGVSHDSLKTVLNHNMKEIKRVRQLRGKNRCADSIDWEGGYFKRNFELLKTYGGVVIANNGDWKQIDAVMRKIQETQEKAIQLNRKAFNPKETKQNLKTLITALFERGAHTPEDKADRNKVSEILQTFKPDFFYFYDTKSSIDEDTYDLIKIIEKKGTAYISVDSSRFYRAVDHGNPLTWKLKQGASSDHAVALVGFSATKHKFYVKDCNTPHIIEMNPKDLFLSMQSGFVLVPKVKKPRAKL